jgi:predicted nuclease of restriction endonuclease-like (RecB) superfamily
LPHDNSLFPTDSHDVFLKDIKTRIRRTQVKASLTANQELIILYWQIGREILALQQQEGWGTEVIDRLVKDLKRKFPDTKGFSPRNLKYMRAFAKAYPDQAIVQRIVAQIPWRHNQVLLDKLNAQPERVWYAQQSLENGWSHNVLVMQIESNLFQRQGSTVTSFEPTLPPEQSDLAQQLITDPYNFDFLNLTPATQERDLEKALVERIRDFLLELNIGFAFVGSQYRLEVSGNEYFMDMLFYHLKLRCYVVIDLKVTEFRPEYTGKMNFYVATVDALLRHPDDQPTIGIVLCKSKNKTVAEYALRNVNTPIAVTTHSLPDLLKSNLPTIEQLEMELDAVVNELSEGAEAVEK